MARDPYISICIPAYEMGGQGAEYLLDSFEHLLRQSYEQFEVIVSDQSDDEGVATICKAYADRLDITRLDNRGGARQASANTNNAMRAARGQVLKVLFQDDFLCDPTALAQHADAFSKEGAQWLLCGSGVTHDGQSLENTMVPRLDPNLYLGKNTVSSPSVLALRAGTGLEFDEELIWLMDVDMYKRCQKVLGAPHILEAPMVANRLHLGQVSAGVSPTLRRRELRYMRAKHQADETLGNRLHYYKQMLKAR
ncbi:glycosyltransferase family 2 protein [Roseovarius faecimaris]|uniref:Glycosyltransferase family 2 protein n=1 Tax=Roseovarius faecimaris TaxID=2494550 RepID=A0A6I6IZS5_9RHOB|nr:glycosyltransferase family 2 protein [Roseovarius faecimaris]QGX98118.1 glycosyltransferase family 2 protein [Roseovarius faecimaris]